MPPSLTFFPQHFMLVGLLFYIPEQAGKTSRVSAPSGGRNLEVVVIIVIVIVVVVVSPTS